MICALIASSAIGSTFIEPTDVSSDYRFGKKQIIDSNSRYAKGSELYLTHDNASECFAKRGNPIQGGDSLIVGNPTHDDSSFVNIYDANLTHKLHINASTILGSINGDGNSFNVGYFCETEIGQDVTISNDGNIFAFMCVGPANTTSIILGEFLNNSTTPQYELIYLPAFIGVKVSLSLSGDGNYLFVGFHDDLFDRVVVFRRNFEHQKCTDDNSEWSYCTLEQLIEAFHTGNTTWGAFNGDTLKLNQLPNGTPLLEQFGYAVAASETGQYVAVSSRAHTTCIGGEETANAGNYGVVRVFEKRNTGEGWFWGSSGPTLNATETAKQLVFSKRINGTSGMGLNVGISTSVCFLDQCYKFRVFFAVYDSQESGIKSNGGAYYICSLYENSLYENETFDGCFYTSGRENDYIGSSRFSLPKKIIGLAGAPRGTALSFFLPDDSNNEISFLTSRFTDIDGHSVAIMIMPINNTPALITIEEGNLVARPLETGTFEDNDDNNDDNNNKNNARSGSATNIGIPLCFLAPLFGYFV